MTGVITVSFLFVDQFCLCSALYMMCIILITEVHEVENEIPDVVSVIRSEVFFLLSFLSRL